MMEQINLIIAKLLKNFRCIHIIKDREICLFYPDIKSSYEFLKRTKEACDLAKTEWMIHLHPDVICQGKISYYPPSELAGVSAGSITGISNNNWRNWRISPSLMKVEKYIRQFQPTVELNGWGWCGGSIMNVNAFNKVYDSVLGLNPKFKLEDIRHNSWNCVTEHEDTMMSVLFALNGFPYRIWKDNPEYHRGRTSNGAFLHGYKEHYDFKKQKISVNEYFKKCRAQIIKKRLLEKII